MAHTSNPGLSENKHSQSGATPSHQPRHTASTDYLPNDLLTPEQTARVLHVTAGTLAVWRSSGRYPLRFIKVGRWVRYRWSDILSFIDSRTKTHVD